VNTKSLRDSVADAAGAPDHEHLFAAEIELVHLRTPLSLPGIAV
jgi:hypothetical protein